MKKGSETNIKIRKRPYEALFNKLRYTCTRDGKDMSLTYEDFLSFIETPYCHYCGVQVEWAKHHLHGKSHRYNLDRKDNTQGYHKDNVVTCCWNCNQIKGSILSFEEMEVAMQAVQEFRKDRPAGLLLRVPSTVPAGQFSGFHKREPQF